MNKADQLGRGTAFGKAAGARSSRREAFDHVLKGDSAAVASLTELPVTLISENPDNPRNHLRNLDETMDTVRELGIIMPIVVATADAYLRDRPDRSDDLDAGAQYVVVDGHRRLECARRIGLATIPVRVDDARVATDEALLEAAFVANYHRDDMTDLEEAHALKALVDYYGSQTKAAKRLGIPQGTLSSKLSLLKLSPELQKDLVTGARKVEHVRNLGKLPATKQKEKADERAAAARTKPSPAAPARFTAVNSPASPTNPVAPPAPAAASVQQSSPSPEQGGPAQLSRRDNSAPAAGTVQEAPLVRPEEQRVPEPRPQEQPAPVPVPVAEPDSEVRRTKMPWDDGEACAEIVIAKMSPGERGRLVQRLLEKQREEQGRQQATVRPV